MKISLDEILTKRQGNVISTGKGDAIVKAMKSPPSWDEDNRTARFIMTTESVDRYGDVVSQAGMNIDNFMKNPQALMFHNSSSWPVGHWSDVTKLLTGRPKRTEGVLNFLPEGDDMDCDRACKHVAAGSIRTVSIGFIPLDWEGIKEPDGTGWTGIKYLASDLVEASLVPIPANPDCLVKSAGGDDRMLRELLEQVLDEYARDPVTKQLISVKEFEAKYSLVSKSATTVAVGSVSGDVEPTGDKSAEAEVETMEAETAAVDDSAAKDGEAEVEKAVADAGTLKIDFEIDTDEAEKKVDRLSDKVERLMTRLGKLFGVSEPEQRIEPTIEPPVPAKASAEDIAAAEARSAVIRQRIAERQLI